MPAKHMHIIGIAGVATSAIAIALEKQGWKITGSDKGFFPPVSTALLNAKIPFYAGWHPEKMIEGGTPDLVMIGGSGKSSENPEMLYAQKNNIPIYSYPQIIEKYFLKENSIVCAGTWGKTTTATLLSYIFEQADLMPTYMFGALSLSQNESAKVREGKWSILEGDEYTGSQFDNTAKFFHYHPTHLLLTSIFWDHADVYKTPEAYFEAFIKLVKEIPQNGLIVNCIDDKKVVEITSLSNAKKVTYGKAPSDYQYENVSCDHSGISLTIKHNGENYSIQSPLLGAFQAENIAGCFAMAKECGVSPDKIKKSISEFKGIKRRMEKRYEGKITIIDDIAHSPEKAASVLATLKTIFPGKIFAVFEPNTGGRERSSSKKYDHAFKDATEVIVPRLSSLKVNSKLKIEMSLEGEELAQIIGETHSNVHYMPEDEKVVEYLKDNAKPGDCIVFLGSHSFRGMIPDLINKINS